MVESKHNKTCQESDVQSPQESTDTNRTHHHLSPFKHMREGDINENNTAG